MEVLDAEARGDHGVIFKKVGPDLRVVPGGFADTIPVQAVAISNKFGLTFFLHSQGFCVAYTKELVEASQSLLKSPKNEVTAQERAIAEVSMPALQSLVLSKDELVIAACTEDTIHFYSVPILLQKGNAKDRALMKSLHLEGGIKCMEWNGNEDDVILILSREGKLSVGSFTSELKPVAEEVRAVDWSPDGQFLCYVTNDIHLCTCKSDLSEHSTSRLPGKMFGEALTGGPEAYVDMLKWVCLDSILISCVHRDVDGAEDDYWIFLLVSSKGHVAQSHDGMRVLSFDQIFTTIDADILPPCSGPYLLACYIQSWNIIIATSRRCIDDHIVLLGWMDESRKVEASKFEIVDDRFTPRIELQASGGDNCVIGLAVDKTTTSIQLPALDGETGEKLPPGPVIVCMTIEGNLSLFSAARTDVKWHRVSVVTTPVQVPAVEKVSVSSGLRKSGETIQGEVQLGKALAEKSSVFQGAESKGAISYESSDTNKEQLQKSSHLDVQGNSFLPQPQKNLFSVRDSGGIKIERPNNLTVRQAVNYGVSGAKKSDDEKKPAVLGREQKRVAESPISEMESEFNKELNKVKLMAREIDELTASIEGKPPSRKIESKALFTKSLMEEIEAQTQNLSLQCQNFQANLMEQRQNINDLRDESMQVDAWRVYLQSVIEQVSDARYQELWHKQKLHPEMDAMRKRILHMDQSLKQQIAELEGHLHNLELSDWQKKQQPLKSQSLSASVPSENFRRIQSLYETVNSQMLVAQQLDHRLKELMEALYPPVGVREDIESLIEVSRGHLESLDFGADSFKKMSDPISRKKASLDSGDFNIFSPMRTSVNMSLQTPTKLDSSSGTRTGLQDSTRRRRNSVDKLWVDVGAAKTTVKRAAPVKHFETISTLPKDGLIQPSQPFHSKQLGRSSQYNMDGMEDSKKVADGQPFIAEKVSASLMMGRKPVVPNHMQKIPASSKTPTPVFGGVTFGTPTQTSSTAPSKETVLSEAQTSRPFEIPSISNLSRPVASQGLSKLAAGSSQFSSKKPGISQAGFKAGAVSTETWGSGSGMPSKFEVPLIQTQQSSVSNFRPQGEGIAKLENAKVGQPALEAQAKIHGTTAFRGPTVSVSNVPEVKADTKPCPPPGNVSHDAAKVEATPLVSLPISSASLATVTPPTTALPAAGLSSTSVVSSKLPSFPISGVPTASLVATIPPFTVDAATSSGTSSTISSTSTSAPFKFPSLFISDVPISTTSSLVAKTPATMTSPANVPNSTSEIPSVISSTVSTPSTSSALPLPSFPTSATSSLVASTPPAIVSPANVAISTESSLPTPSFRAPQLVEATPLPAKAPQGPPILSDEEDMEEEEGTTVDLGTTSFSGFGLGSSTSPAVPQTSRPFGISTLWNQSSPAASGLSVPAGQLFKPSSFSIPAPESTSQPTSSSSLFKPASFSISSSQSTSQQPGTSSLFSSSFTSTTGGSFGNSSTPFGSLTQQPMSPFGKQTPPAAAGGQQILGSALGTFGQTRQIGSPFGVSSSPTGFGFGNSSTSAGFAGVASTGGGFAGASSTGGGFAGVASTSGGFAGVASTSGGFSGVASTSGGFAGVASTGGGFAGVASTGGGFAGLASGGGGFAGLASGGGGFAGLASGGSGFAGLASGGSGGFANAATGGGFAGFNSAGGFAAPGAAPPSVGGFGAFNGGFGTSANPSIFSQMRK